jgi:hypothetical protein
MLVRLFMRSLVLLAALALGCNHYHTPIPGVLDLRSDGAGADPATAALPSEAERQGLDALLKGTGTTGTSDVEVHERAVWALRLLLLSDGAAPEIGYAFHGNSALRKVVLQEEMTPLDAGLYCCALPIPLVDIFALVLGPTYSFQVHAQRVSLDEAQP